MRQTALILEERGRLSLREIELDQTLGDSDVRIAIDTVGICGSDIHYYLHGGIGDFVVREPMVLGHEASGLIIETGKKVSHLKTGDRVCMEPGIPNLESEQSRLGIYNLDPEVKFWATPPIHGCLLSTLVHPASYTFKLPDAVTLSEGAMVEPLAVGVHAATKAAIRPGETALVTGAGPIGMVTALAALAGGCSRVLISDIQEPKLKLAATLGAITPINVNATSLKESVAHHTDGKGVDMIFEASGHASVFDGLADCLKPAGRIIFIGMPVQPVPFDIVKMQIREASSFSIFRYANAYPRALALMGSGKTDVKPLITDTFPFERAVEAFEFAARMPAKSVKVQIHLTNSP